MGRIPIVALALCLVTALVGFFVKREMMVYLPYATIIPALFFVPRTLYRRSIAVRRRVTREWSRRFEQVGLILLLLNIPGVLVFHRLFPEIQYDRIIHFGAGVVGIPGLVLVCLPFARRGRRIDLLWAASLFAFVFLFAWEGFQYSQDAIFGTRSFFDYAQPLVRDFWEDIFFGALGASLGLVHTSRTWRCFSALRNTS